jgi:hypothetical protein
MVPSCDAGCKLLVARLHDGYRVTHYLFTESRLIVLPNSRNPTRCLVFVNRPTHMGAGALWTPNVCFGVHVAGGVCLVVCRGGLVACVLVPCCRVGFDRNTNTQARTHPKKCRVRQCVFACHYGPLGSAHLYKRVSHGVIWAWCWHSLVRPWRPNVASSPWFFGDLFPAS